MVVVVLVGCQYGKLAWEDALLVLLVATVGVWEVLGALLLLLSMMVLDLEEFGSVFAFDPGPEPEPVFECMYASVALSLEAVLEPPVSDPSPACVASLSG